MRRKERILEEYLVVSARLGDRRAFAKLVSLRGPRLLAHAIRLLGNRDEAADAVQDAWLEIVRGLPGLRESRAFPAWALRIVTRRCARLIKGNVARRAMAMEAAASTDCDVPDAGPDAADARTIRDAIAALPREQATTIALFYLEDLNVAEVAIALDIPAGTVKTRLMHARKKLYDALKGGSDEQTRQTDRRGAFR